MNRRAFKFGAIAPALITPVFAGSGDRPPLELALVNQRATPQRVAQLAPINGELIATGPLTPYSPGPATRALPFAAYDLFEGYLDTDGDGVLDTLGPSGAPWDNMPGCSAVIAPGLRWFFGADEAEKFLRERGARNGFTVEQLDVEEHGCPAWNSAEGKNLFASRNVTHGTTWCVLRRD